MIYILILVIGIGIGLAIAIWDLKKYKKSFLIKLIQKRKAIQRVINQGVLGEKHNKIIPDELRLSQERIKKLISDEVTILVNIYNNQVTVLNEYMIEVELKSIIPFKQEFQYTLVKFLISFYNYPIGKPEIKIQNKDELYSEQITTIEKYLCDNTETSLFSLMIGVEDILFGFDQQKFKKIEQKNDFQSTTANTMTQCNTQSKILKPKRVSNEVSKGDNQQNVQDQPKNLITVNFNNQLRTKSQRDIGENQFKNMILGKFNQVFENKIYSQIEFEIEDDDDNDDEDDDDDDDLILNQPQQLESNFSRFTQDFEDIQKIGAGGFGKVYKAKNRLDCNHYAIKQILLDYDQVLCQKTKNEAIFLSRLQHTHIVRYYQSWTEEVQKKKRKMTVQNDSVHQSDESDQDALLVSKKQLEKKQISEPLVKDQDLFSSNSDNIDLRFDKPIYNEADIDIQWGDNGDELSLSDENKNDKDSVNEKDDKQVLTKRSVKKAKSKSQNLNLSSKIVLNEDAPLQYLYIQMEYCKGKTLKDLIDSRQLKSEQKKNIISQILEALSYLHQKRYIHRDLKPQNIFLDDSYNVKLGDFGLATQLKADNEKVHQIKFNRGMSFVEDADNCHDELTKNIGTTLYLAPEQQNSSLYDQKVDMFSLGIIMFEMYYDFRTNMERQMTLLNLKKDNIFPPDFEKRVGSDVMEKIKSLIQIDSQKRPGSKEFLLEYKDKQFEETIEHMVVTKNQDYKTMIHTLFKAKLQQNAAVLNFELNNTYLEVLMLLKKEKLKDNILLKEFVRECLLFDNELECIFKRYGAHRYDMNNLCLANNQIIIKKQDGTILKSPLSNPRIVYLLTEQGVMLQYSNNLIEPLIQNLNSLSFKSLRRYSFTEIMRCNLVQPNLQYVRKAIGFDIIWSQTEDQSIDLTPIYLSDLFALTVDILNVLIDSHSYIVRISHTQFFHCIAMGLNLSDDFIIRFYASNEIQTKIKRFFNTKLDHDQQEVLEVLKQKFSMTKIDAQRFLKLILLKDRSLQKIIDCFMEELQLNKQNPLLKVNNQNPLVKAQIMEVCGELDYFHQLLQTTQTQQIANEQVQIQFETYSFAETRNLYHGIHFDVLEKVHKVVVKKSDIKSARSVMDMELSLIVGGCYSNYLDNKKQGCGIQIQSEILLFRKFCKYLFEKRHNQIVFQAINHNAQQQSHSQRPFQIDVVIYSEAGEFLIKEKLKLAHQIRRAGYSAMYLPLGNKPKSGGFQFKLQVYLKQRGKEVKGRIKSTDSKLKVEIDICWEQLFEAILLKLEREIE